MKDYLIAVHGCDDSTHVSMTLTDEQAALLSELAEKVEKASTYQCMPTMEIKLLEEASEYQLRALKKVEETE